VKTAIGPVCSTRGSSMLSHAPRVAPKLPFSAVRSAAGLTADGADLLHSSEPPMDQPCIDHCSSCSSSHPFGIVGLRCCRALALALKVGGGLSITGFSSAVAGSSILAQVEDEACSIFVGIDKTSAFSSCAFDVFADSPMDSVAQRPTESGCGICCRCSMFGQLKLPRHQGLGPVNAFKPFAAATWAFG